ncbi:hypothetical protein COLO4_05551 [Corchorus olitorius]|uniref:Homeobox domain-containing protein n=1 Tax=Corchorus olitorius TaxID=93759 RepID=A0A1R3KQN0_9ROSI|nr:hypothetical protein COLO4_05551 [Corchorus olitorius]
MKTQVHPTPRFMFSSEEQVSTMEEELYRLDDDINVRVDNFAAGVTNDFFSPVDYNLLQFDHQKHDHHTDHVGAPPELASLLEEIGRENLPIRGCSELGADPELDEFMESYCEVLHRYKEELSKPFDEATSFLSNIESQLNNLCKGQLSNTLDYRSDEAAGTSEEELSGGEVETSESQESAGGSGQLSQDIKGMLMQKYSGYLSSLRKEFLKKRKKGKLPKDARMALLEWWSNHYRWPYPTEEEKLKLSEITGLDQKQINNWFINQRKRHWKPSEDMKFALLEGVTANIGGPAMYLDTKDDI